MTSTIAIQRAVAATFYSELIGKVDCGAIWLDAIINTLHDAKSDSSSLVRKLATIGLARIAYLSPRQVSILFQHIFSYTKLLSFRSMNTSIIAWMPYSMDWRRLPVGKAVLK